MVAANFFDTRDIDEHGRKTTERWKLFTGEEVRDAEEDQGKLAGGSI